MTLFKLDAVAATRRHAVCAGLLFATVLMLVPIKGQAALVAHWTFDTSVNADVGTVTSTANGDAAIDNTDSIVGGGSLVLDGTGDFVALGADAGISGLADYTIATYIKMDSSNVAFSAILATDTFANEDAHFSVVDSNNSLQLAPALGPFITSPGNAILDPPQADWVHVAVTGDGTNQRMYINGVQVAVVATTVVDVDFDSSRIGSYAVGGRDFDGHIDDLRIYDNALTAVEVLALSTPPAAVPEPSSMALIGLVGGVLAWRRRRSRR